MPMPSRRRAPLSNVPNGANANSPLRHHHRVAAAIATLKQSHLGATTTTTSTTTCTTASTSAGDPAAAVTASHLDDGFVKPQAVVGFAAAALPPSISADDQENRPATALSALAPAVVQEQQRLSETCARAPAPASASALPPAPAPAGVTACPAAPAMSATSTATAATAVTAAAPAAGHPDPRRHPGGMTTSDATEKAKLFARPSATAAPSAFERRLVASRKAHQSSATPATTDTASTRRGGVHHTMAHGPGNGAAERQRGAAPTAAAKQPTRTYDNLRTWQRHYKRAFPAFVFYFDNVPDELRQRLARQVVSLGASEDKFFSRAVTHVVTSRAIPPESGHDVRASGAVPVCVGNSTGMGGPGNDASVTTVNPSLLQLTNERGHRLDPRTATAASASTTTNNILYRARQMNMKLWTLEKCQRVLGTLNDPG
ncbi:hypothetical protein KEM52_002156, partial [Ascosphaera acerosa]